MKKPSLSINCCPRCAGGGKIWDFGDPEEPTFFYCELCKGKITINN
ncbi:MAG: hypothetical protein NTY20_06175 [Candidatus Aenigmarchaeota archaeon]|nr:hypothetical protein [Candidatus Aenigmarchaeota archaeon]